MSKNINIEEATESLIKYWETYPSQYGYKKFRDETFIDDALYGLGVSIDADKFKYADGYRRFKDFLIGYLDKEIEQA